MPPNRLRRSARHIIVIEVTINVIVGVTTVLAFFASLYSPWSGNDVIDSVVQLLGRVIGIIGLITVLTFPLLIFACWCMTYRNMWPDMVFDDTNPNREALWILRIWQMVTLWIPMAIFIVLQIAGWTLASDAWAGSFLPFLVGWVLQWPQFAAWWVLWMRRSTAPIIQPS